jgi:hypothetical protein
MAPKFGLTVDRCALDNRQKPLPYLIRPDGYVGLFQRPVDERALRAYLAWLFAASVVEVAFAPAPEIAIGIGAAHGQ